jgi:DUF4097 and DUF4098 domain-containing protein YvlB
MELAVWGFRKLQQACRQVPQGEKGMNVHRMTASFLILIASSLTSGLSGCKSSTYSDDSSIADSKATDSSGAVSISKMGGDIDVKDAPHGATLSTMGGNIHLGNVDSFAKVKTMGGAISIDQAAGSVDATTMGGEISIGQANGAIQASTMGGDIRARMVGASSSERDVELTSKGGTITLTVPKDFPMDVKIKLAYTKNAPRSYAIVDHIGLDQQETPDWDSSFGSPRKIIRARGRVGSGLNHVTIETVNGDVILKQE